MPTTVLIGNKCKSETTSSTTSSGRRSNDQKLRRENLRLRSQGHSVGENILEVPSNEPHDEVVRVKVSTVLGNASEEHDAAVNNSRISSEVRVLRA